MLENDDGQGVGFLACGTSGHPELERRLPILLRQETREDFCLDVLPHVWVAEELRHPNEEIAVQRGDLLGIALQDFQVRPPVGHLLESHAPVGASLERSPLVGATEVHPVDSAQQIQNEVECLSRLRLVRAAFAWAERVGMLGVFEEDLRHLFRRQNVIACSRGDRILRHAVVFRGFGTLHEAQTTSSLDTSDPGRSVVARAGQHDAHRDLLLILSE